MSDADLARVNEQIPAVLDREKTPWYLQPFIFLGALIAGVMLSAAVLSALDFGRLDEVSWFSLGAVYLAAAVLLHRQRFNIFTDALALALSLGGHGFVLVGVGEADGRFMAAFLVMAGLCAVLYPLYRDHLHRYLTCLLVFVLAKAAFPDKELGDVLHVFVLLSTCAAAFLLTQDRELPDGRPMAEACCTGLLVFVAPLGTRRGHFDFFNAAMPHPWISSILLGLALLWVLHWASQRPEARRHRITPAQQGFAVLVTAGLAALSTPGLLAALFLAVLGHATYRWPITLLGLASLPVFLWKYYYSLEMDYLAKSGVLAASGALLLLARWAITYSRWLRPDIAGREAA
jgi:hypothetical protein